MDNNSSQYRKSFSQRNGFEPAARPLDPDVMPYQLRLELEDVLMTEYQKGVANAYRGLEAVNWLEILGRLWVYKFSQQRTSHLEVLCLEMCKRVIFKNSFHEVFTLLEWFANEVGENQPSFQKQINGVLSRHQAPYLLHNSLKNGWMIIQTGTEIERDTVLQCLFDLQNPAFMKTMEHFEKAGHWLTNGAFAESVGQSTKAIEACLKKLSGKSEASGGDALKTYAKQTTLPHSLQKLMEVIWRYRNEAEDVGHSKRDNASTVEPGREEAQLLYGITASCLSFLINKWRKSNDGT